MTLTTPCMSTVSGLLAVTLALAGAACGDNTPSPGGLTERDKTPVVERAIDGAPGMSLVFTRARDDGWRQVDVKIAGKTYPFHTDGGLFMLDANGQGFGGRAAICGMATPDVHGGTNLAIRCAIADASGLGPIRAIETPTSAWLGDVCADGDHVTLLYAVGPQAIDPDAPADQLPCEALTWDAQGGWATDPVPSATCACGLRDGGACSDPCFLGSGVYRNGTCDPTNLPSACDDHDPGTDDFCTGDPTDLCYAIARP